MAILAGCCADREKGRPEETKLPVKVSILSENIFGTGFEKGDKAGLFVVNGLGGVSVPESLSFNLPVTFGIGGKWNTEVPMYYSFPEEAVTFYCVYPYFPYEDEAKDAKALHINVNTNQRMYQDYRVSDIRWGKSESAVHSGSIIEIDAKHIVSRLRVVLEAGTGWDSVDIMDASVILCGFYVGGSLDVESGTVINENISDEINAYNEGDAVFSAFLLPQSTDRECRLRIIAGENDDELNVSAAMEAGKDYTCTVTLDKSGGKFSASIKGWEIDDNDYGGSV